MCGFIFGQLRSLHQQKSHVQGRLLHLSEVAIVPKLCLPVVIESTDGERCVTGNEVDAWIFVVRAEYTSLLVGRSVF